MQKAMDVCAYLSDTELSARLGQLCAIQQWVISHWDTQPQPDIEGGVANQADLVFFDNPKFAQRLTQKTGGKALLVLLSSHAPGSQENPLLPGVVHLSASSSDADLVARITTALNVARFQQQFFTEHTAEPITKLPHHPELLEYMGRYQGDSVGLVVVQVDHADYLYSNLDPVSKTDLLGEMSQHLHNQLPEDTHMGIFDATCFMVWCPNTNLAGVRNVAKLLTEVSRQPINFRSGQLHFTLSIGLGFERDLSDISNLWNQTWVAKEEARNEGGNRTVEVNNTAAVSASIPEALVRDEFSLVLQPQWDADGQTMRGVEALLRWQGMEVGNIAADHFIPIVERSGQMARVGDWVLERAACESTTWLEHLVSPILLGVNVSPQQFTNDAIKHQVQRLAKEKWLDPSILELELSHGNLLSIVDEHRATLYELRDMGVRIAIDNLGTTVVDTQKLLRCPADTLKIDRSLVRDVLVDPNARTLVEQICLLGQKFQLQVVAVGVETEEQRQLLSSLGCQNVQGYLLAEPIPLERFHDYLSRQRDQRKAS